MCGPTTAARSSSSQPVSNELTRGMTSTPPCASCGTHAAVMVRALFFSSIGTESSMSGTKASGVRLAALVSISARFPGTNKRLLSTVIAFSQVQWHPTPWTPHPNPLPEGRGAVKLAPLCRRSRRGREKRRWVRCASASLGTCHGVDLCGTFGQVPLGPALAAVLTGEYLSTAGGAVHALGLPLVEGNGKHGGFGLDVHLHPPPGQAAVGAAK